MPPFTILLITALSVFVLGNIYRFVRVARMPSHLRWELYPIPKGPHERQRYGGSYFEDTEWWTKSTKTDGFGQIAFMLKEVFLLRGVYLNFRPLWVWSALLHWGLYLYIASTTIAVGAFAIWKDVPSEKPFLLSFEHSAYSIACALGIVGSLGLLVTRALNPRLKGWTTRATVFNLCLLASIFASGLIALLIPDHGLLVTLRDIVDWHSAWQAPSIASDLHLGLLAFFLVYFPFTHMTHMFLKYFTWHGVRWDDRPAQFDERGKNVIAQNLARQVSWQALHIRSTDPQSWADVASRSGSEKRP